MPLLSSPIDGTPMRQISRYGIEIDVCPTTGGIWLDKGELEKLMALIKEDAVRDQSPTRDASHENRHYRPPYHDDGDDEDDDSHRFERKGYYGSGKYHRKGSKMSRLMDLFDF